MADAAFVRRMGSMLVYVAADHIEVRWASEPEDLRRAVELRKQVFCEEQGVPLSEELDGRDREAEHIVALEPDRERVIGTLRLLVDGPHAKVGRVAVAREQRRRGIASRMLALALARAGERGCTQARLAAQLDAVALYEQAGFTVESERFEEAGIPHVWMGRELTSG